MNRLTLALIVATTWATSAHATIVCDFVLQPGGLYNDPVDGARVPASGGRREIAVFLRNSEPANDPLGGFQFDYQADRAGAIAITAMGSLGSGGTGTRYNTPDWSGNWIFDPMPPSGPIPTSPGTLGLYGTVIVNGNPNAASHLVGWIVVDLAPKPAGNTITIRPTNLQAFGVFGANLDTAIGQAATFVYVPEPGMCLFAVSGGLMFVARRRVGGVQ